MRFGKPCGASAKTRAAFTYLEMDVYNMLFLSHLEESRRALFGSMPSSPVLPYEDVHSLAHAPTRGHGVSDTPCYVPPPGLLILDCYEYGNGEWVPRTRKNDDPQE